MRGQILRANVSQQSHGVSNASAALSEPQHGAED